MVTVSVALKVPSLTVNSNVSGVFSATFGAMNEGVFVVSPAKDTVGLLAVWLQEYFRGCPSGSVPLPLSVTAVSWVTV